MPLKRVLPWKIPETLLKNERLNDMILSCLPKNYNFEIHKTIWRIQCLKAKRVALQMPEGLLIFAISIVELLNEFSELDLDIIILGDVTYGACCVDDFSAKALDVDLLVHYGHSCLIPLNSISVLYVFVDIRFDADHFVRCILTNFNQSLRLAMVSTIQFVTTLQSVKEILTKKHGYSITIPQSFPLSPGEILGCTSPKINGVDVLIYLGDGRFHLESAMIANPLLKAYKYDPYDKSFTQEMYDHREMRMRRKLAIDQAKNAKLFGTLGRQGSSAVISKIEEELNRANKAYVVLLMSEIFPNKLKLFGEQVDAWVQVACPRLSIDWGTEFDKPILTPYELFVTLDQSQWPFDPNGDTIHGSYYPMDYYANNSSGPWTPNHTNNRAQLRS